MTDDRRPTLEEQADHVAPDWRKLMYRLAGLQPGRCYQVTIIVHGGGREPVWGVDEGRPLENQR